MDQSFNSWYWQILFAKLIQLGGVCLDNWIGSGEGALITGAIEWIIAIYIEPKNPPTNHHSLATVYGVSENASPE